MPDAFGWRRKFGVVTPLTNPIVQREYDEMRLHEVTNHISRMVQPRPLRGCCFSRLLLGTGECASFGSVAVRRPVTMCGATRTTESAMKTLNPAVARVLKRLHYPLDVILTCVRWYVAYPLSLRHLEDMMAERGVSVDHSTVHRWAVKLLQVLEKAFCLRKRPVGKSWRMDETYSRVKGEWRYLYRAVDRDGNTIDFLLRAHRDKTAARRYIEKSIAQNGAPETVTIDRSGANLVALEGINADRERPINICQSNYLNDLVEQDHRAIKRRTRPMLGFKSFRCARIGSN
jgi:putative transposase